MKLTTVPCSLLLELKPCFARRFGQRLDAPVIQEAAAIEDHLLDAFFLRLLGDRQRLLAVSAR